GRAVQAQRPDPRGPPDRCDRIPRLGHLCEPRRQGEEAWHPSLELQRRLNAAVVLAQIRTINRECLARAGRLLSVSSLLLRRQNRSGARTAPMLSKLKPVQCVRPIQVVDSRDSGDRLFSASRRGGGGRRDRQVCTETHHHDYCRHRSSSCRPRISVLAAVRPGSLCASIIRRRHCRACHLSHWVGPIGAIIVGLIAGTITLFVGQIALMTLRSPFIRAGIALLFAVPAAIAGYYAALGVAHICIPAEGWSQAMALIGA